MAVARAVPLAVLLAVLIALVIERPGARQRGREAAPLPASLGEDAHASTLAAPFASSAARVADRSGQMLHEDPRHTHRAAGHIPRRVALAWKLATDGPIEAQVAASADQETLYVATLGGSLWAVTRKGTRSWDVALGGRAYASPAVADDGTIYVGSDAGFFYAVAPTGRVKWKLEVGGEADTGAALLPDGTLVFAAGNLVFGVRPSGDIAWRFAAKGKVFTAPAVSTDGFVIFGSQDDHAYALSLAGALVWASDLGADVDGGPAIGDDGSVFLGTDAGEVVRLGGRGEILWRTKVGGFVRGTLSVARNGDVLAGVYGPSPREVRIAPDGVLRGAFPVQGTGAAEFGVHGGALEDDQGSLVFGAQDDRLYAVGSEGRLLWDYATEGDVDAPATLLSDGTLVVGSDDGHLYALTEPPPK